MQALYVISLLYHFISCPFFLLLPQEGWRALICASQNGHDNVVEKLMAAGADYDHQNMVRNYRLLG